MKWRRNGIVIYETTHHENLPALLDLSVAHFGKVAVFVNELSYTNLSSRSDPKQQWPKVQFIILQAGYPNRPFIRAIFTFLRRSEYSHFHLSTLDNNLLLFALRLVGTRKVHVSMTIHAVNDFFSYSFASLKAVTESLAKYLLHRRIKNYNFFLPAMVQKFSQRLPGCTAVSIPSRFYAAARREPGEPPGAGPGAPPGAGGRPAGGPLRIVIPGSVDPVRRDYEEAAAYLAGYLSGRGPQSVFSPAGPRPIELVILGDSDNAYGVQIASRLRELESPCFRLIIYKGNVPAKIYEETFATADLIWSPLRATKTERNKRPEVYGLTIASGLTADLQLGCAPVLTPAWLELPDPFRVAVLPYDSEAGFTKILDRVLNDPSYYSKLRVSIHLSFTKALRKENYDPAFRQLMDL
jgi:hypothetical protein